MTTFDPRPTPGKILLTDIDPVSRRLCANALDELGFAVVNGPMSGAGIVAMTRQQRPQVIFISQQLTDAPVGEVIRWLHANPELGSIPVIVIGGKPDRDLVPSEHVTILARPVTTARVQQCLAKMLVSANRVTA